MKNKITQFILKVSLFNFGFITAILIRDSLYLNSTKKQKMCITEYYNQINVSKDLIPSYIKRYIIKDRN